MTLSNPFALTPTPCLPPAPAINNQGTVYYMLSMKPLITWCCIFWHSSLSSVPAANAAQHPFHANINNGGHGGQANIASPPDDSSNTPVR
ncbi:hypothetical protein FRB91_008774, partial [Serendipita sp. 411]